MLSMRKKDDKVGDKTHGYTKKEGGQKEKKEREKALKDRNMGAKKRKKEAASLHPISRKNMPSLLQMRTFV